MEPEIEGSETTVAEYASGRHGSRDSIFRFLRKESSVAGAGLILLFLSEFLSSGWLQDLLADAAFGTLLLTGIRFLLSRDPALRVPQSSETLREVVRWRWTFLIVTSIGIALTQTWFRSGTAIAGGDITPPLGTAWIHRIFSTFAWSGSNLGSPAVFQGQLPWAFVNLITHGLGGSGALAQRLWLSFLVAAILIGPCLLARALRLTPTAGAVAALLYFYSPLTLSEVGFNDVFLSAMALAPILAATLIFFGNRRVALGELVITFVLAAPFLGFVYANPPLVGLVTCTTVLSPLLVWLRYGREDAKRSVYGLFVGGLSMIGASSYWIIPAHVALTVVNSGSLSQITAWGFTEVRSTLANAFWLNTAWGWQVTNYFPYAKDFARFPLNFIPALVPFAAFSLLAIRRVRNVITAPTKRTVGFFAIGSLLIIFLSTGTRTPGNLLFDPLYKLPYGWLLREPGRFLIVADLGYALLSAMLVTEIPSRQLITIPFHLINKTLMGLRVNSSALTATVLIIIAFAASFPEWTGEIVSGADNGFPSEHVTIPAYWQDTGSYLNASNSPRGAVMVLPADDFYQMPYTWYYGNDGFITNLFQRHVVVPSPGGYTVSSNELLNAVTLESSSLLKGDWDEAERLLAAVGTPIVLVRGDIESNFNSRSITSPQEIASALSKDPDMKLIYSDGPLSLFETVHATKFRKFSFATVNLNSPNLRDLEILPNNTALVSSKPIVGHEVIYQVPPINQWLGSVSKSHTRLLLREGWNYKLDNLNGDAALPATLTIRKKVGTSDFEANIKLNKGVSGSTDLIPSDSWGNVGNCDDAFPVTGSDTLSAHVLPSEGPHSSSALSLSANIDSACVSKSIPWQNGPLLLKLDERAVSGQAPRFCLWEESINECAKIPTVKNGKRWTRVSVVVNPDPGTKSISLFLYADAVGNGSTTTTEYANVKVTDLVSSPDLVVIGTSAETATNDHLLVSATGYSSSWSVPSGAIHVLVDGIRNGWIVSARDYSKLTPINSAISREPLEEIALSSVSFLIVLLIITGKRIWRRRNRYLNFESSNLP